MTAKFQDDLFQFIDDAAKIVILIFFFQQQQLDLCRPASSTRPPAMGVAY